MSSVTVSTGLSISSPRCHDAYPRRGVRVWWANSDRQTGKYQTRGEKYVHAATQVKL